MDLTVQAHMGVIDVTGFPDGAPVKAGVAFMDFMAG
jgi:formyl-CoA transferase|eukprot:COSAG06_NODE_1938_length_8027_cov_3.050959_3_plen_36_part_00